MKTTYLKNLIATTALSLVLTACGGGGGSSGLTGGHGVGLNQGNNGTNTGNNNNGGTNTPATPTPPQTGSNLQAQDINTFLNSNEYNRSSQYGGYTGLAQVNAAPAYAMGTTGQGITIAVVDTGIDMDNPEFDGALSNKSINILRGNRSDMENTANPHGTWAAGVIGARMNGQYTMGVAYNSTIMAIRADTVDSICPTGCFLTSDLAKSAKYAADNGARIINMSLGTQGSLGQMLTDALKYAAAKNVLIVAAAGNQGAAEVDSPANIGLVSGVAGSMLAVGAVDEHNVITSFSNRAGAAKNFYLVAPGDHLLTTDTNGMALTAGTSFSTPMVSGAAALVMQAAPHLTAQQVASILLTSATDLGATGVDDVYGHGLLNIGAALSPLGNTTVPNANGSGQGASASNTQMALGSAFGDALSNNGALKRGIMLDSYGRAFGFDMSKRVTAAEYDSGMSSFIASRTNVTGGSFAVGSTSVTSSFTEKNTAHQVTDQRDPARLNGDMRLAMSTEAASGVGITYLHGHNLGQSFGLTEASTRAASDTAKADMFDNAFLGLVEGGNAMMGKIDIAQGLALNFGGGMQDGTTSYTSDRKAAARSAYAAELAYNKNGFTLGLQVGQVNETQSALASESDGALAFGASSSTSFVGVNAAIPLMQGLTLAATYQIGLTNIDNAEGSLIGDFRDVRSDKFALALMADDVARKGDRVTLSVSQPLRVASGSAALDVPVGVDANGTVQNARQRVNLSPSGRQTDIGLAYNMALSEKSSLGLSSVGTLNPGNDANADAAIAVGVRYTKQF